MDDNEPVTVDFIFPAESEALASHISQPAEVPRLGRCSACGEKKFILASELGGDRGNGIPASRMYECTACGTYHLG